MQLSLIVLTGYVVAVSPVVSRLLELIAGLATSDRGAVALMGLVSMGASWLHWGLGLIAGPIFLQFLVRKHPRIDYRLAVAAGYLGSTCTWHAGLSGSVPLLMATPKNFMEARRGPRPHLADDVFGVQSRAHGDRRLRDDGDGPASLSAGRRRADHRRRGGRVTRRPSRSRSARAAR